MSGWRRDPRRNGGKKFHNIVAMAKKYIDTSKIFGSLTIKTVDAPFVCGAGNLLI